jgi:hypothetical protein
MSGVKMDVQEGVKRMGSVSDFDLVPSFLVNPKVKK